MNEQKPTALIAGASRGLGHAMAAELVGRGWNVIGTVRDRGARTPLHERLSPRELDVLFVSAGTTW